ncbi:MAG: hypothetical protein ACJAQT_001068 [Akkermansiaceae bacterium]|jgi:hypothetical protein
MKAIFSPGLTNSVCPSAEAVVNEIKLRAKAKVVTNLCFDFMKVSLRLKLAGRSIFPGKGVDGDQKLQG